MNASKEQCQSTLGKMSVLSQLVATMIPQDTAAQVACYEIMEFLQKCEKRLPSEESIEKNKKRKRSKI